jgi:alkylation response protein AidB-like acyl-CoA dehydrogenase
MEHLGRGLVVSPFVSTAVVGATAIEKGASASLKSELLPAIASGRLQIAFPCSEPGSRFDVSQVRTVAIPLGSDFKLSGRKSTVIFANSADLLLVSAHLPSDTGGAKIGLFLVDTKLPGVSIETFATHEGGRASEVQLTDVRLGRDRLLGGEQGGDELFEQLTDVATAALCADAVGAMWAVCEQTTAFLKLREQFGVKLASFQALQHRMVDVYIKCELAESLAIDAIDAIPRIHLVSAKQAVSAAKYQIGVYGSEVGKEGIQLHGGIGITEELGIGHYFKRLTLFNHRFGDPDHHLRRYASIAGLTPLKAHQGKGG